MLHAMFYITRSHVLKMIKCFAAFSQPFLALIHGLTDVKVPD